MTKIVVKLTPIPQAVTTLLAAFETTGQGGAAVSAIIGSGILPAAIEMMDALSIEAAEAAVACHYPQGAGAVLIVELDGPQADVEAETAAVRQIAKDAGAFEIREAADADDRAAIWRGRRAAFAAVGRISPAYIVQDGVVPRTALPEVLDRISALSDAAGLRVANVFHAGDGNLHPLVLFDDADPAQAEAAEELSGAILDECIAHGGSITGEHGVGVDKSKYMSRMFSAGRSGHHATAALRVRPGGPVQSRQDLPDPEAVRRSPRGQAGTTSARHVRADRPFLSQDL